jgi:hypothetical protein
MKLENAIRVPKMRFAAMCEASEENTMNIFETAPVVKSVVGVFFTCVACGTVEEIRVPREEGLPPKVYWECLTCQMRDDGSLLLLRGKTPSRVR